MPKMWKSSKEVENRSWSQRLPSGKACLGRGSLEQVSLERMSARVRAVRSRLNGYARSGRKRPPLNGVKSGAASFEAALTAAF